MPAIRDYIQSRSEVYKRPRQSTIHLWEDCYRIRHKDVDNKDTDTIPRGYYDVCPDCRERFENGQYHTTFSCEVCERDAVGLIKVEGTTRYLCRAHYRDGIEEYADVMSEHRLLPAD